MKAATENVVRKYLDGINNRNELKSALGANLYTDENAVAIVTLLQIKNFMNLYLTKKVTLQDLIDWVNFVWFSGYCDYEKENEDRIAEILNILEELDEFEVQKAHEIVEKTYQDLERKRQ